MKAIKAGKAGASMPPSAKSPNNIPFPSGDIRLEQR